VFDLSEPLPTGGTISQADGTSWMAMFALNLLRISLELAQHDHVYEDLATKFFEHFLYIAQAMTNIGDQGIGLWDDEDGLSWADRPQALHKARKGDRRASERTGRQRRGSRADRDLTMATIEKIY
jgi:hypothetical protein